MSVDDQLNEEEEEDEEESDEEDDQLSNDSDDSITDDSLFLPGPNFFNYPPWVIPDGFRPTVRNFSFELFPYEEFAGSELGERFRNDAFMKTVSWTEYQRLTARLLRKYRNQIVIYFPTGLDPTRRQQFCSGIVGVFPFLSRRYREFRDLAGIAKDNDVSYPSIATAKESSFKYSSFPVSPLFIIFCF